MCIDYNTSILSFAIGMSSGFYLSKNPRLEVSGVGKTMMCICLVQLIEAGMYKTASPEEFGALTRLLAIALSFQGTVAMHHFSNKLHRWLYYICLAITVCITASALSPSFKEDKINSCLDWDFIKNNNALKLLALMYIIILSYGYTSTRGAFQFLCSLIILTWLISYLLKPIPNKPSMWCLTSALASPIMIWYTRNRK